MPSGPPRLAATRDSQPPSDARCESRRLRPAPASRPTQDPPFRCSRMRRASATRHGRRRRGLAREAEGIRAAALHLAPPSRGPPPPRLRLRRCRGCPARCVAATAPARWASPPPPPRAPPWRSVVRRGRWAPPGTWRRRRRHRAARWAAGVLSGPFGAQLRSARPQRRTRRTADAALPHAHSPAFAVSRRVARLLGGRRQNAVRRHRFVAARSRTGRHVVLAGSDCSAPAARLRGTRRQRAHCSTLLLPRAGSCVGRTATAR